MPHSRSACSDCPLSSERRVFLQDSARLALGAFLALGLTPRRGVALAIRYGTGRREAGHSEVSYPIPPADGATIDKQNQTILVRFQGTAYAFALSCPHQNTALHWREEEQKFQCPKHKSQYQPDGTFLTGRATRNMDRMPIRSDGKQLLVDVEHVYQSDKDPSGWAAAHVKL
jgi:nitrite reductase/ring-hydroxylating ferredoxin subunit